MTKYDTNPTNSQAPKRRAPAPPPAPKPRLTKLAKENNITNDQESEIREAFSLFAETDVKGYVKEKAGVIKAEDVRRCLVYVYLLLPLSTSSQEDWVQQGEIQKG
jgi:hypothetical protein